MSAHISEACSDSPNSSTSAAPCGRIQAHPHPPFSPALFVHSGPGCSVQGGSHRPNALLSSLPGTPHCSVTLSARCLLYSGSSFRKTFPYVLFSPPAQGRGLVPDTLHQPSKQRELLRPQIHKGKSPDLVDLPFPGTLLVLWNSNLVLCKPEAPYPAGNRSRDLHRDPGTGQGKMPEELGTCFKPSRVDRAGACPMLRKVGVPWQPW